MSTWSKKTYEMVANIVRTAELLNNDRAALADRFAVAFRTDNPRFDIKRFQDACDPEVTREQS